MRLVKSFKSKLVLSYILIIFISLGLIAFFLDKNLEENYLKGLESSLVNQAKLIESQLPEKSLGNSPGLELFIKNLSSKIGCRITIIDGQGKVLADSEKPYSEVLTMENHARRPEVQSALNGITGQDTRYSSTLKIDMLYLAYPLKAGEGITGVIRLAMPLTQVQHMLVKIRREIFFSVLLALILAYVLSSILTAGITRPINKIIHVSRRISSGDFSPRVLHNSEDEIGELASVLNKMAQDIEDKIKEIEKQNQHLKAVFQGMVEGIIVIDKASRIISLNEATEKIFNIKKHDVDGKIFLEAIRNNDISDVINTVLEKGEFISRELTLVWPVQKIFQINAAPIFEHKAIVGCILVIHDVSQIRQLENMRRDFVANVSHELKTPLTSIKGFIETLLAGAIDDKENSRQFLNIILKHADRLDNLVSDLLSLSHLESREIKLIKEDADICQLIKKVISGFGSQLDKKNIKIINEVQGSVLIKADKDRIEQVLTNLIDNAIKFNKDGGSIKVFTQDFSDKLKIIVEDSGVGISSRDIPRIFERFYRVDKARSRELGGTGLGLSIVKHIVELHSGAVGVESTEGLGSKFWFFLPK